MTLANEMNSEIPSTDAEPGESIEESLFAVIREHEGDGTTETGEEVQGESEGDAPADKSGAREERPGESELSAHARALAAGRKKRRQVVEGKELAGKKAPLEDGAQAREDSKQGAAGATNAGERLEAPQSWNSDARAEFAKLPEVGKRQVVSMWGKMDAHFTQTSQELAREKTKYGEIEKAVAPFVEEWGIRGLSPEAAIRELAASYSFIRRDRVAAYSHLLAKAGVTLEMIQAKRQGHGTVHATMTAQNSQNYLTPEEVDRRVEAKFQERARAESSATAVQEVESLKSETLADGRDAYPELREANSIERLQPLVSDIRKTNPNLSWREVFIRGINALRLLNGNGSHAPSNPRLPQAQNTDPFQRARAASVSVRPRGGSRVVVEEAQPGESVEQSIRATMQSYGQL